MAKTPLKTRPSRQRGQRWRRIALALLMPRLMHPFYARNGRCPVATNPTERDEPRLGLFSVGGRSRWIRFLEPWLRLVVRRRGRGETQQRRRPRLRSRSRATERRMPEAPRPRRSEQAAAAE